MSARIVARSLTISFTKPDGEELPALGPVTTAIEPGQFVALVGPSGSGKSTLIRALAGLQPATSGGALIDDEPIRAPSPRVALMFQDANLMPWRTVVDNIALPLELAGIGKAERQAAARDLLPLLGLAEFAATYPAELSGGMAQRAALGRVLIQRPAVLLLDEPFGALDALTREQISQDLLAIWAEAGQTIVMVTHDINEAVLLADRVLVLSQRPGRIVRDIWVPLPRPRQPSDIYSENFGQTAQTVRAAIEHG
ncbi:MAG: ABC transporter ATP-binding protein [Chloroflexi bacterium]|nr:ABC transporter ATP-binding protein [Chloroflexota bacterium]